MMVMDQQVEALKVALKDADAENARLKHLLDESEKQRSDIMEGFRDVSAERDQALADLRGKDNEIDVLKWRVTYLKQFKPKR
jgi:chromosome segregation ATPase